MLERPRARQLDPFETRLFQTVFFVIVVVFVLLGAGADAGQLAAAIEGWGGAVETLYSIAATVAIVMGGMWTYMAFVRNREAYPAAHLTHTAATWALDAQTVALEERRLLLHVVIGVENSGTTLLPLEYLRVSVEQVLPPAEDRLAPIQRSQKPEVDDAARAKSSIAAPQQSDTREPAPEVSRPKLAEHRAHWAAGETELEPGETDYIHFDFVIPRERAETIAIYSFLRNEAKPEQGIGWTLTDFYNVDDQDQLVPVLSPGTVIETA